MPEAGTDSKSPKIRRPPCKGDTVLSRSVHWDSHSHNHNTKAAKASATDHPSCCGREEEKTPKNTQPDSHPQVGQPPPLPNLNRPPSGQWYTAVDPTRSVNLPGAQPQPQPAYAHFSHIQHHPHVNLNLNGPLGGGHFQQPLVPGVTYVGASNMGDYQNCVPPPTGVNFQPPVPDTTFGPIPHVYVPRFDAGPMYGGVVQQPVAAAPPGYVLQPGMMSMAQQPVMLNGQAYIPATGVPGQPMMSPGGMPAHMMPAVAAAAAVGGAGGPMTFIPGNPPPPPPTSSAGIPDVSGLGRTPNEETLRQVEFAYSNRLFEPQEFKPADDDPSRFYYVREVDGNWTQRNRFSIDQMGDSRWYVTDEGWFYAVRLPD